MEALVGCSEEGGLQLGMVFCLASLSMHDRLHLPLARAGAVQVLPSPPCCTGLAQLGQYKYRPSVVLGGSRFPALGAVKVSVVLFVLCRFCPRWCSTGVVRAGTVHVLSC